MSFAAIRIPVHYHSKSIFAVSKSPDQDQPFWMEREDNRRKTHWRRRPSLRERRREWLLREWYGTSWASEEIVERQPPAHMIAEDIDRLMAKTGGAERALLEQLRREWPDIVGADIAKYTAPDSLQNQRLLVEVSHPAWMYVLEREHMPVLIERIQAAAPDRIREVRLIQKGRRRPEDAN